MGDGDFVRHNHLTRDIRPQGECLACDVYHAKCLPSDHVGPDPTANLSADFCRTTAKRFRRQAKKLRVQADFLDSSAQLWDARATRNDGTGENK